MGIRLESHQNIVREAVRLLLYSMEYKWIGLASFGEKKNGKCLMVEFPDCVREPLLNVEALVRYGKPCAA